MKQTPKGEIAHEAPLTWTSENRWGSVGRTYSAEITLDNGDTWAFQVDQPSKGYWMARGWRNNVFALYREDRTMKGAREQCQAQANLAATSTCGECRKIGGHTEYCATLAPAPLTAVDEGAALLEVARSSTKAAVDLSTMSATARGVRNAYHRLRRPPTCKCPTPTHRMSCGSGSRPVVVWRPLAEDVIPDHLYHESCPGTCCGGNEGL